jgi:hypothetical protein
MLPLIFIGVEIILLDNSVLNVDLLNTQTSIQNNLIMSLFSLLKQLFGIICGKGHTQVLGDRVPPFFVKKIPRFVLSFWYFCD